MFNCSKSAGRALRRTGAFFYKHLATRLLLRSTGLGIVAALKDEEPRKVVVYRSLWVVPGRSVVHLIPATGSCVLVAISLNGFFVSEELQGDVDTGSDGLKMSLQQVASRV